jgi:hypothetical protein
MTVTSQTTTQFDPTRYGLELSFSPDNLLKAQEAYSAVVTALKSEAVSTADIERTIADKVRTDEATQLEVKIHTEKVREIIFDSLEIDPAFSVILFDLLGDLRTDVKTLRDWYLNKEAKSTKVDVPTNLAEKRRDAELLRDFVISLFKFVQPIPKNFKVKTTESGETVPDLPRIPSGPRDSDSPVGRGARVRSLQFEFYREADNTLIKIPKGTHLRDVLVDPSFGVSRLGVIYSWDWIKKELENTEQDMFSETPWEVELQTGILKGWLEPETKQPEKKES